ncbi:MAG: cation transporter dimerization domain-containing protein, partial [Candidatus Bathyarchaeia archaeon]
DAHVEIEGYIPLNQAHSIASRIEEHIVRVFPNSDILIHTEPHNRKDPIALIRTIASQIPEIKGIHGIIAKTIGDKLSVTYHLELESGISLKSAHEIASRMEKQLKKSIKNVSTIISHLEPALELLEPADYSSEELVRFRKQIFQISQSLPCIKSIHEIQILAHDRRYSITLHCTIDGSTTLAQAHDIITKIEEKIKMIDDKIHQVTIHCEPEDGKSVS